jgi:predicted nucleic acid-binding protein
MLVVDAGWLFEVLTGTPRAEHLREVLLADEDHLAPHLIDAEVFGAIRQQHELGRLDTTAARQAVEDLREWPGQRIGHRHLLDRAWELRATVRGADALYVALAEAMDAPLVTTDHRLARAPGPPCEIVTPPA